MLEVPVMLQAVLGFPGHALLPVLRRVLPKMTDLEKEKRMGDS
jgi:hypothetical protein